MNRVLSDRERGGFYASQDADITLDDDGDYFTWTLEEVRAVLARGTSARRRALLRRRPHRRDAPQPREKRAVGRARRRSHRRALWDCNAAEVERTLRSARAQLLAAREKRPTPFVDTTLYTSWNAMFISAYLEAASAAGR